jgi:hypothetical protein
MIPCRTAEPWTSSDPGGGGGGGGGGIPNPTFAGLVSTLSPDNISKKKG